MRLVYFGSGEFGLPTLRALAGAHEIVGVVTQPDRPAGRGRVLTPTPIGAWAQEGLPGVPVLKPESVNAPPVVARVRSWPADAWVVIAFGQKLSPALLEGRLAINLHASLLPRWRGAAPINAAVLAGDEQTGNSVITLADRMDAGEILAQSRLPIAPEWTAGELHDRLSRDGPALVLGVLRDHERGTLARRPQDETLATRAPKLSRADAWVDLTQTAEQCRRRIHALSPWPGVTIRLQAAGAEQELKVLRVSAIGRDEAATEGGLARDPGSTGTLIDPERGLIACGQGSLLRLLSVTPPGKRTMSWNEFAQGRQLGRGTRVDGGRQG